MAKKRMTHKEYGKLVRDIGSEVKKMRGSGMSDYSVPYQQFSEMLDAHPLADITFSVEMSGGGIFTTTLRKVGQAVWDHFGKAAVKAGKSTAKKALQDTMDQGVKMAADAAGDFVKDTAKKHGVDLQKAGVNVDSVKSKLSDAADKHVTNLIDKADKKADEKIGAGMHGDGMRQAGDGMKMTGEGHMSGHGMEMTGEGHCMKGSGFDDYAIRARQMGLPPGAVQVSQFNHLNFAPQAIAGNAAGY